MWTGKHHGCWCIRHAAPLLSPPRHPPPHCSAEGLKAALALAKLDPKAVGASIPAERLEVRRAGWPVQ